jgi:hypothetical protein
MNVMGERCEEQLRCGEVVQEDFTITGLRTQRAYMLLESELDALIYTFWASGRRRIIKRIKSQTSFDEEPTSE